MEDRTVIASRFFADEDLDLMTRDLLGHATYGGTDVGEVLATVALVTDGDTQAWVEAWTALGDRLAAQAGASARAGHRVSAASASLRAAVAYGATLGVLAGEEDTADLIAAFRRHRSAWDRFCALQRPAYEPVDIPYEGSTLPGWFAPCDDSHAPRPVVILNNGGIGPVSSMYVHGGAGALARGYHALYFDGPGQQSELFEHRTTFRPDWEAVVTPVVDFLRSRPDVDADGLVLLGVGQAGYWVPRSLAFEHRLAAAVADPGVVDVATSWLATVPTPLRDLFHAGDRAEFTRYVEHGVRRNPRLAARWRQRSRPYGRPDGFTAFAEVSRYRLDPDVAARIRTPLLVTTADDEQLWPGQSVRLAAMTPGRSTLVTFGRDEGAGLHGQPMARRLTDERVFDWLDEQLGRTDD